MIVSAWGLQALRLPQCSRITHIEERAPRDKSREHYRRRVPMLTVNTLTFADCNHLWYHGTPMLEKALQFRREEAAHC